MRRRHVLLAMALLAAMAIGYFALKRPLEPASDVPSTIRAVDSRNPEKNDRVAIATNATHALRRGAAPKEQPAPLPPPGAPLKETYAELQRRAITGDADAASRLYRDIQHCRQVKQIYDRLPSEIDNDVVPSLKESGVSPELASAYQGVLLDISEENLHFAQDNDVLCMGVSNDQVDASSVVPNALLAAQLGDLQAADCYVAMNGLIPDPNHPEWVNDYQQNAWAIANSAIEKGDWNMVMQMATAYGHRDSAHPILLSLAVPDVAILMYRYNKLWSLGIGNVGDEMPRESIESAGARMTSDEIADANQWASQMYQNNFNSSRIYDYKDPRPCDVDDAP